MHVHVHVRMRVGKVRRVTYRDTTRARGRGGNGGEGSLVQLYTSFALERHPECEERGRRRHQRARSQAALVPRTAWRL